MDKVKYCTRCISDSLTINNKETAGMSIKELKKYTLDMVSKTGDIDIYQNIIGIIIEFEGEYNNLGYCEWRGDHISKYIYEF